MSKLWLSTLFPSILETYLYSCDTAINDEKFRLRKIVTIEFAAEIYELHKHLIDRGYEIDGILQEE